MLTGHHTEMPEDIEYEYQSQDAGSLADIRGYLYRRRRAGWMLFWIEGKSLHFRRRVRREDEGARAA